jgi:hypothetical protein
MIATIQEAEAQQSRITGRPFFRIRLKDDYDKDRFLFLSLESEVVRRELEYQLKVPDIIEEPLKNWKGKILSVTERTVNYRQKDYMMLMLNINVVKLGLER